MRYLLLLAVATAASAAPAKNWTQALASLTPAKNWTAVNVTRLKTPKPLVKPNVTDTAAPVWGKFNASSVLAQASPVNKTRLAAAVLESLKQPLASKLGVDQPPTAGCAALVASAASTETLPDGTLRLFSAWSTFDPLVSAAAKIRSFVTVAPTDADHCVSVDAGLQYTANVLPANVQPSIAAVNAANPPFCTDFGGKLGGATVCEEPWLFDDVTPIGAGTPFQPFVLMKPAYEPVGHPPFGVYGKRHISVYFSFVPAVDLEANFPVGPCSRYGLISVHGFKRALAPVPAGCWPSGPQWRSRGLAIAHVGQHVYSLLGEEYVPPYNKLGMSYSYGFGALDAFNNASVPAGQLLWYEVKGAADWVDDLIASGKGEVCEPINGAPSAYATAGYKPGAVCIAADSFVVTYRVTKLAWHGAGCAVGPGTVFDPNSFAPAWLEATDLNPACVAPSKLNATAYPTISDVRAKAAGAASAAGGTVQLATQAATAAALGAFDADKELPLPPDDVVDSAAVVARTIVG